MNPLESDSVITVRQLKDWLANVQDFKADGDPAEVWVETGHSASSPLTVVSTLNKDGNTFDVFLGSSVEWR